MNLCHELMSFNSGHNMDIGSYPNLPLMSSTTTGQLFKSPSLSLHTYKMRTRIAAMKGHGERIQKRKRKIPGMVPTIGWVC